jgi:hypothetical protein
MLAARRAKREQPAERDDGLVTTTPRGKREYTRSRFTD